MSGYLEHHGFRRGAPEKPRTDGPVCGECRQPMLAGQRGRHGVCSPLTACCGHHVDLIPDMAKHSADHALARMSA